MNLLKTILMGITLLSLAQVASASEISQKAIKLQKLAGEFARNDSFTVNTGSPLTMVKNYIFAKYKKMGDLENAKNYSFIENARNFHEDEQIAGTVSKKAVLKAVSAMQLTEKQIDYATSLINEIEEEGGYFGFDGFEQNGCAAPTTFLLVIDPSGKVFGIDLAQCSES